MSTLKTSDDYNICEEENGNESGSEIESDSYHGHSLKELPIINNTSNLSTICSGCMEWENLFINHSINLLQSTITTMREIQDNKLKNDSTLKEIKACVLVMLMVISNYV
ncbi:10076_t:CDS:2 [Entrophospora sp. SA101]|nr:10076_t:CDS:2 [Entrophospora sp. SA101]